MSHATEPESVSTDISDLFRNHKEILWAICYRMTGCAADADDIVQETFARALNRARLSGEMLWRPWLIRVATNLSFDLLRHRRRRRYETSWLPSPIEISDEATTDTATSSPDAHYEWRESLSFAFLLAIEVLSPRQRAVLVFRDVFDYSARATAELLAISERNVRITHLRARRLMQAYDRTRRHSTPTSREQAARLLQQFIACLMAHDVTGATALLTESVRAVTDGGGEYTALRRPVVGREAVLTLHMRVAARRGPGARVEFRRMNGAPAVLVQYASAVRRQAPRAVIRCEMAEDGRINELHTILASRKLTGVPFSKP